MIRNLITGTLFLLLAVSSAQAQNWARKMFKVTSHDFGTVARGSKQHFEFELTNIWKEDVHIQSVRTSCGCTTPSIKDNKQTLKTYEKGAILAVYNTRSFLGKRSATITVTIDKPFFAEVQLFVNGYIRSDVVFSPGVVDFGETDMGSPVEKKIGVSYAGRDNWSIVDIRSANEHIEVELGDATRGGGRVKYDMVVRLKGDAPSGFLRDELTIITDDRQMTSIPLAVEGRVIPSLTVSPASMFLGVVEPGQKVTKQLVVRGKKPFRIKKVNCPDGCFHFDVPDQARTIHLIPVTFTAGDTPGKVKQTISIETDLGSGQMTQCTAVATVKPAQNGGAQ